MGNPVDMFVLQYIFLPRINHVIASFVKGWNKHPLRSMKNWSPERIWANGMFDLRNRCLHQVLEFQDGIYIDEELQWYGMDWHAPRPTDDGLSLVDVTEIECPLEENVYSRLLGIDPLEESNSFGTDLYLQALQIVS